MLENPMVEDKFWRDYDAIEREYERQDEIEREIADDAYENYALLSEEEYRKIPYELFSRYENGYVL